MTAASMTLQINGILSGVGVSSSNRLATMCQQLAGAETDVFWPVFQENWGGCDTTWNYRSQVLALLRRHAQIPLEHLSEDDQYVLRNLPPLVTIYRGCSRDRVRGLSWTTNRAVAVEFAEGHRGIRVPLAVVATAVLPRVKVFTVFSERSEDELLVDPDALRIVAIKPHRSEAAGSFDALGAAS